MASWNCVPFELLIGHLFRSSMRFFISEAVRFEIGNKQSKHEGSKSNVEHKSKSDFEIKILKMILV
jgi:hypothetical protein